MTALAADAQVVRLGTPVRLLDRSEMGRMAVETTAERLGREGTAQIAALLGGSGRVVDRPVPPRLIGIAGHAVHADLPLLIACQKRLPLMVRSQGVFEHG